MTAPENTVQAGLVQEIRRGFVVLACLGLLRTPRYGYSLLGDLADAGIRVDGNTLYPLLRRLEKQGLLTSSWNTEGTRPRKFYAISPAGERVLGELALEWSQLDESIRRLLQGERHG